MKNFIFNLNPMVCIIRYYGHILLGTKFLPRVTEALLVSVMH